MSDEPDLFDWQPPVGAREGERTVTLGNATSVVPFPLASRRRKVMRAARTLTARRTEQGRASYWNRTVADLVAELERHGVDPAEIGRQLDAFHRAVSIELSQERNHA